MVRIIIVYKPFGIFFTIGLLLISGGAILGIRFLYFFLNHLGTGHIQSLILASILVGIGFQTVTIAFISDLQSVNRKLLEDVQYRLKKIEMRTKNNG